MRFGYCWVLTVANVQNNTPCTLSELAELADVLNLQGVIHVYSIHPILGSLSFWVDKEAKNGDILETVCSAITSVFNTDIGISFK